MAKLYFRYSSMNAGKSIDLIKTNFNYNERGQNTLVLTSDLDNRYDKNQITSRIGLSTPAFSMKDDDDILSLFKKQNNDNIISCVLVDEVQFFTKKQIYQLSDIVDYYEVPVICYGLRSDFLMESFNGSKYLLTICDSIEELKCVCWCGKKATTNARLVNGKIAKSGEQIHIGGNESYISLCRKHYKEGKISN